MISSLPLILGASMLVSAPSPSKVSHQVSPALVTTLSGTMNFVKGTLKSAVVPSNLPQSITIMVGTTPTTITNCLIVGSPAAFSGYSAGSPFVAIKAGSAPLSSNFAGTSVFADVPLGAYGGSRRTVPMSATGALTDSVAFPDGGSGVVFLYGPCTSSGLNFNNGVIVNLTAFPASYNIAWPSSAVSPTANVLFRTDEAPPYYFSFLARGAKSTLTVLGQGQPRNLNVAASLDVTGSVFQSAHLFIQQGYIY